VGLIWKKISNNEIKTLLLAKFGGTNSKRKDKLGQGSDIKNEDGQLDGSQMNELNDFNEFLDDSNVNL